jgi:hypothetical protein
MEGQSQVALPACPSILTSEESSSSYYYQDHAKKKVNSYQQQCGDTKTHLDLCIQKIDVLREELQRTRDRSLLYFYTAKIWPTKPANPLLHENSNMTNEGRQMKSKVKKKPAIKHCHSQPPPPHCGSAQYPWRKAP